jgi:hypothetical protein
MSSAQPGNRPPTDSPVAVPIRPASPTGFPFLNGYYDPDSSSYDDDVVAVDAGLQVDGPETAADIRELVPA